MPHSRQVSKTWCAGQSLRRNGVAKLPGTSPFYYLTVGQTSAAECRPLHMMSDFRIRCVSSEFQRVETSVVRLTQNGQWEEADLQKLEKKENYSCGLLPTAYSDLQLRIERWQGRGATDFKVNDLIEGKDSVKRIPDLQRITSEH